MSTGSANPTGSRLRIATALLLPALLAPGLAACSDDSPVVSSDPDADVADSIQRTLRQRARALADRDTVAFARTLAHRDSGFVADQEQYFENLGQLPLGTLRLEIDEKSLEPDGEAYWAEVTIRLELQGYDVAPVVTRDRWRFAPTRNERRYLLTSTEDPEWEAGAQPQPQPWDLGEIEVRNAPGVLGIFDPATVADAETVLDSVSEGRFDVRSVLPVHVEDPGGVVVYTLADPAFLESLKGLPIDDPDQLDGATIAVPTDAASGNGKVSSYRVVLSPHVVDESEAVLDRLVRHELTHVALGDHARGVPLWFNEGLAEYVSVQSTAPSERRLQTDALNLVAGGVDDVPADAEFRGEDAEGWYAVSWWVCEYIAATYGEDALWTLLDGLADGADPQSVVEELLGTTTSDLVRGGIALMRRTYG